MHKTGRRHRHTRLPQLAKGILHVMLSNKATKQHARQQSWRGRFSLEAVFVFRLAKHWSPCRKRSSVHHLTLLYVFSTPFHLPSLLKMSNLFHGLSDFVYFDPQTIGVGSERGA